MLYFDNEIRMKAILALVSAAFFWGLNFHLLKVMLRYVDFIEAGFWRYLVGVTTLAVLTLRTLPSLKMIKTHLKGIGIVGILGLFCFNILLFVGLRFTSSLNASLIISLTPVLTIILSSLILKVNITFQQFLAALVGISGVLVLILGANFSEPYLISFSMGDLIIIFATLVSAFYQIWVKKYIGALNIFHFTFLTNLSCLLAFIAVFSFQLGPRSYYYNTEFWTATTIFGCLGTSLTYILWNYGVGAIGPAKASLYMGLVPFFTAVIGVFNGEEIFGVHIISGILILISLLLDAGYKRITSATRQT